MFRHLAVGVDGSADADGALGLVLELARRLEAVVHALHVVDTTVVEGSFLADLSGSMGVEPFVNLTPQVLEALERLAGALEERVRARAEEEGVELRWRSQRGFPARALLAMAQGCALLAVGKRGLNAAHHGELLGPVTERLLRLADLPVLVVPPAPRTPERALLAHDGSPRSERAMMWGGELAARLGLPVTVLTATADREVAEARLAAAVDYLAPLGLELSTRWREESPERALEAEAAELAPVLVVVGARGRGRLAKLVLGSTTEYLARRVPEPLLSVP